MPRVLLYTDSRAVDVTRRLIKRDPLHFYPGSLARRYSVQACIVPHKHTTIVDFLFDIEPWKEWADVIICHAGIVDFSPRTRVDAATNVYQRKKSRYDQVFSEQVMLKHLSNTLPETYYGEPTQNMFSIQSMEARLIPRLKSVPNLIFIGCNPFVPGWRGNYFRERPSNMEIVLDYSAAIGRVLERFIDLSDWDHERIKRLTCDNIHLTPEGSRWMEGQIINEVERMTRQRQ